MFLDESPLMTTSTDVVYLPEGIIFELFVAIHPALPLCGATSLVMLSQDPFMAVIVLQQASYSWYCLDSSLLNDDTRCLPNLLELAVKVRVHGALWACISRIVAPLGGACSHAMALVDCGCSCCRRVRYAC